MSTDARHYFTDRSALADREASQDRLDNLRRFAAASPTSQLPAGPTPEQERAQLLGACEAWDACLRRDAAQREADWQNDFRTESRNRPLRRDEFAADFH